VTVGRRMHQLGVGLVALALLAAATLLDGWLPGDTDDPGADPFVRPTGIGESVDLRTARVQVDSVRVSKVLLDFGTELRSPGVWVLIELTAEATREDTGVRFAELRDDEGRVWSLTGRSKNLCTGGPPGVPVGCAVYFEVPPDALDGLRLRLAREPFEQRYDVVAEVDLGLTDEDAAAAAGAPALEVPDTTLGGG
jgi:hypothetical protein